MEEFKYGISKWLPYKNREISKKVAQIKKEELVKHKNPDFNIRIIRDSEFTFRYVLDIFLRIKKASESRKKLVLILPQPNPEYAKVAELINRFNVDCSKLWTFNMDEWADEDGVIAPDTWPNSFMNAMKNNFYYKINEDLRPPENQIIGPNEKNYKNYGDMIEEQGGADACYGGIGWCGHLAFIEPGSEEFAGGFEEWKEMGTRLVTLNPFTIAQSSLDPDFGMSGNWGIVPPRAVTIGPREILKSKLRCSWNGFSIANTQVSWQRFIVRLAAHGEVTPLVPASILQISRSELVISETVAADISYSREFNWYA